MSKVQINNCSLANVHKFRCASPSGTSFCFLLGISFCIAGTQTGGFVFQRLCWLGEASIQVTSFHLGCHLLVFPSIFWENTCCNRHRWCLSRLLGSRCVCCRLCRHPLLFSAFLCCSSLVHVQVTSFHLGCHLLVFPSICWENTCCNRHRWCVSRLLCSRCFCCRLCRHPNLFPAVLLCSLLFSAVPLWFGSTIMCLHSNYFIYLLRHKMLKKRFLGH